MTLDLAKQLGSTYRDRDKLVSGVARHLMKPEWSDRRSDCVHPSEASHDGWCPRSTYYRIMGEEPEVAPRSLTMEMVFERGHDSHRKWQGWAREMGILRGTWKCRFCGLVWWDVCPADCPRCEVGEDLIDYDEVPVQSPEYLLFGNADGDVWWDEQWRLIEVKTIGTGTIRYDAPKLLEKYSYTHIDEEGKPHAGVDWYALWSGIRRPFSSHLRQGMTYCFCQGRSEIIYIYDPKFITAYPKEFEIKFNKEIIEDVLDDCIKVKNALEKQRPPKRPMWAEETHASCKACPYQKICWRKNDVGLDRTNLGTTIGRKSNAQKEELALAPPAKVRFTEAPFESDGHSGRGRNAAPRKADPLSRSRGRAAR